MNTSEKIAFLKGLIEGMDIDKNSKEVRIVNAIVDVLDELVLDVTELGQEFAELDEYVDVIDEALTDLEDDYYCDDDDDFDEDFEDDDDEDDDFYEVTCDNCKETIVFDESLLMNGNIKCPNCNEEIIVDVSCDCELCNCNDDE